MSTQTGSVQAAMTLFSVYQRRMGHPYPTLATAPFSRTI